MSRIRDTRPLSVKCGFLSCCCLDSWIIEYSMVNWSIYKVDQQIRSLHLCSLSVVVSYPTVRVFTNRGYLMAHFCFCRCFFLGRKHCLQKMT